MDYPFLRARVRVSRGHGAYLQFARGKSKRELSRFLWTRGLWLIVLEVTVIRVVVTFNVDYQFLGNAAGDLGVWVCRWCRWPRSFTCLCEWSALRIVMIALHNLLDGFRLQGWQGPQSPVPGVEQSFGSSCTNRLRLFLCCGFFLARFWLWSIR